MKTTRKYKLRKRAEQQAQTRDRIVEALVSLHEEIGPRNTTISAVAERAGVQRLTVYRHFPDDTALFQACSARWIERNPPPAPAEWAGVREPVQRTEAALAVLYAYYRGTERMCAATHRDEEEVEALGEPMRAFRANLTAVRDDLLEAWQVDLSRRRPLELTLSHALTFPTWQSLKNAGLGDEDMASLVVRWVRAAAEGSFTTSKQEPRPEEEPRR
jgi:AcrR family transcriptional regulator